MRPLGAWLGKQHLSSCDNRKELFTYNVSGWRGDRGGGGCGCVRVCVKQMMTIADKGGGGGGVKTKDNN